MSIMTLDNLINLLRNAFKDEQVKQSVLDDKWYELNKETGIDSLGFCFASSEVVYRLFGGKENWKIMRIGIEVWEHGTHYYLYNKETNEILDITSDQYTKRNITIPYNLGKVRSLRRISNKAKSLAKAIDINLQ